MIKKNEEHKDYKITIDHKILLYRVTEIKQHWLFWEDI